MANPIDLICLAYVQGSYIYGHKLQDDIWQVYSGRDGWENLYNTKNLSTTHLLYFVNAKQ